MGGDSARPMWRRTLPTMLVLAIAGPASDGAICPARCRCNDDTLSASCARTALEVVPIQLNPEVRHIDLSNNKINLVHFTLSFYHNLLTLDLSSNKIKTLGSTNFESQRNLKHLNLSRNDIEKIYKDSLKGLRAVTTLDLSYNRLEELTWETFRELHYLQVLNLSKNRLTYLEEGIFKSSKHLQELILDHNSFLEMPTMALVDVLNLRYLSVSYNLLKTIEEDDIPNMPELRTLLLAKNVINDIHEMALSGILTLEHLDLGDNNFTAIPTASLAKLANLTKLKLSGNFFTAVPPVAFRGLFHLRFLKLDRQDLLERIDVRAFVDNINLERVSLDDNIAVERLPTRLFHGNPRVVYLSIRNNRLTNLEVTHFPLDQLRVLKLSGNPLQCNCSLAWLWHLVQEQRTRKQPEANQTGDGELAVDLEEIRCAGPEKLTDVLLVDATESQVDCSVGWVAAVSAATTALFALLVVGGLVYWGPMRRARAKEHELAGPEGKCCRPNTPAPTAPYDAARPDKGMMGTPLAHRDYRSLPSWDAYPDCASTMNIYEQLDVNKTRPHIVYV